MKVLAAVAHPDDIEFHFAGSLLLLKEAGCEIHMINLANGCFGTETDTREVIISKRAQEARDAAALIPATMHPSFFDDFSVFYDAPSIQKVAALVREIQPDIVITHNPFDYMEDHQNTCRLTVSAAFARGMVNYETIPRRPSYNQSVRIYHALPHGIVNYRNEPVLPDFYINIESVIGKKREMLACHRSQKEWLDASQGMDSYLDSMVDIGKQLGQSSGMFPYAEGLIRHNHLGFCHADFDPLASLLKSFIHTPQK